MGTDQITSFGRYVIESLIGVGGSGRVYRAFDPERNRVVALKVLNVSEPDDDAISKIRFRREFQAASQLNHPHLVKVYDTGTYEEREYFTMELIEGEDLDHHLNSYDAHTDGNPDLNHPDRLTHFLDLLIQTADALSYLHGFMYVHRDLKPGNVLIRRDSTVKVTDFGLMKQQGSSQMTRTGAILGTVEYMSPEQTVTTRVDCRSDLYSFGVIAFKVFTGTLPFSGSLMRQLVARTREEAPDPRIYNPKIDTQICHFIMKLLKRRPEDRFASAREVWDTLIRIRESIAGQHSTSTSVTQAIEPVSILVNDPACVGRDSAISEIRRLIEILRHGTKGSLILVHGDAGVGKTRLIDEIRTLATFHNIIFQRGTCRSLSEDAMGPWIEMFRGFSGILSSYCSDDCSKLHDQLEKMLEMTGRSPGSNEIQPMADAVRYQFFDLASRFFIDASRIVPMILHLEDAHLALPDAMEFLQFLTRRAVFTDDSGSMTDQPGKLILIVTHRVAGLTSTHALSKLERLFAKQDRFRSIRLEPLTRDQSDQFVNGMLTGEIAIPDFGSRIHRIANGNPLCISEFVRFLVSRGSIHRRGVVWVEQVEGDSDLYDFPVPPLPAAVLSEVRTLLDGLLPDDLRIANAVAVLAPPSSFGDILATSGLSEESGLDALDRLLARGILLEDPRNDERFEFNSPFLPRGLLDSMTAEPRRELHRTAMSIPVMTSIEAVRHAMHADDSLASSIWIDAIRNLMLQGSIPTAARVAHKALTLMSSDAVETRQVRIMFGKCLTIMNRFDSARELFSSIIEPGGVGHTDEIAMECEARIGLAEIESGLGNIDRAITHLAPMISRMATLDPLPRIDLLQTSAVLSMSKGDLDAAASALNVSSAMCMQTGDLPRTARSHHLQGMLSFYRSDYAAAADSYRLAIEIRTGIGDALGIAQTKSNWGVIQKIEDRYEEAAALFSDAARIAEQACDVSNWALYLQHLASIQLKLGAIDQSVSNYRRALAIFEESRMMPRIAMCLNNLGSALMDSQKLSESLTMFVRALSIYEQLGHQLAQAACLGNISVTLLELDQLDLAQDYLDRARAIYNQIGTSPGYTEAEIHRVRLLTRMNRFAEAEEALRSIDTKIHMGRMTTGLYHFAQGELGAASGKEAIMDRSTTEHLEMAVSSFREARRHGFAQIASMKLGRYLVVSGIDRERGEMILEELRQES